MKTLPKLFLTISLLLLMVNTGLNAQNIVWMAGDTGSNANPGSRTAQKLTLGNTVAGSGALTVANLNGQIFAIDAGNYTIGNNFPLTFAQGVTINGESVPFEIIVNESGAFGLVINAGSTDVITLKNITINAAGSGAHKAIQFNSGQQLIIENCEIIGFIQAAITIASANPSSVVIKNTTISNCPTAIDASGSSSDVTISNVSIQGATGAAIITGAGNVEITDSFITQNTGIGIAAGGLVNCANTLFASNGTAVQSNAGATLSISNNDFFDNGTAIDNEGGAVATANNNRIAGSTTTGSATTSIIYQ